VAEYLYNKTHEYLARKDGEYTVGISEFAVQELGDITFVELPAAGSEFRRGEPFATVESVKAVSEVYAPVDMAIVSVNEELAEHPELLNEDPLGNGYFAVVRVMDQSQISDLISDEDYKAMDKSGN